MLSIRFVVLLGLISFTVPSPTLPAAPPHALSEGQLPDDWRLQPLKDLNGYFPFQPPKSRKEWDQRSADVRRRRIE